MEKHKFLPIGSVVVVKGEAKRKIMIITRALAVKMGGEVLYFEYGGGFYPSGLVGDQILYFNEEDIETILFKGYEDEDDKLQQDMINQWLIEQDLKKGSVEEVNKLRKKQYMEAAERARNMTIPSDILK